MKRMNMLMVSGLLLGAGSAQAITVDGNISDWAAVPILVSDPAGDFGTPGGDIVSLQVTNDASNVYFLLTTVGNAADPSVFNFLHLDTDRNAATGCGFFGIGFEFGITLRQSLSYIGDARDCGWSPADFPGALVASFNGNHVEFAVGISVLQLLTPGVTGFDVATSNDEIQPAAYSFAAVPEPGTLLLMSMGLLGLGLARPRLTTERKKKRIKGARRE
jgi:hypothetical protein